MGGGELTGPNPTDRRKLGSKHHLVVDGGGVPLEVPLSGANKHDVTQLLPLIANLPQVRGKPGHPRSRPDELYTDRAYDSEPARAILRWLGIEPYLGQTRHGSRQWSGKDTIRRRAHDQLAASKAPAPRAI